MQSVSSNDPDKILDAIKSVLILVISRHFGNGYFCSDYLAATSANYFTMRKRKVNLSPLMGFQP